MHGMHSSQSTRNSAANVVFMPGIFNETMNLLADAREYFYEFGQEDQEVLGEEELCNIYTSEMSRITLRLSSIMAWIIAQRAVVSGKIPADVAARNHGLDFQDICLVDNKVLHGVMPPFVCLLLDRTLELYERVQRLDSQYKQQFPLH